MKELIREESYEETKNNDIFVKRTGNGFSKTCGKVISIINNWVMLKVPKSVDK